VIDHVDLEQRTRAFVAKLGGPEAQTLAHLLACGVCRDQVLEKVSPPPAARLDAVRGAPIPRPGSTVESSLRQAEARQLYRELLALEPRQRHEALREARFRSLDLAELLLSTSEQAQPEEPRRSEELASLAWHIADQAFQGELVARADDAMARARCLMGNARRLLGDPEGAEVQLRAAVSTLTGAPNSRERGFFCQMLALLREDQKRPDEATALLWRAVGIFRERGETESQAACLCRLGFLFFEQDDFEHAVRVLTPARELLSAQRSPALLARCNLGLAVSHAMLGREDEARALAAESRLLRDSVATPGEALALDWLEGKLALQVGELALAEAKLDGVRKTFLSEGRQVEAALCSAELACVLARQGERERIETLFDELYAHFALSPTGIRIRVAMRRFVQITENGRADFGAALAETLELIRRPGAVLKTLGAEKP
jgi:tetratricopeptide (TPR) repeat protein